MSTAPTWESQEFPVPTGEKDTVTFLNDPARQGPGEATATLRSDGSAGLLYLAPGRRGSEHGANLGVPGIRGAQQAVDFLNEPARQGPGQASVTPRNDGSAGLLYLVPGSLGTSTKQTWHFKDFPAPNGVTSALAFLNAHPRQGAAEASGSRATTAPP